MNRASVLTLAIVFLVAVAFIVIRGVIDFPSSASPLVRMERMSDEELRVSIGNDPTAVGYSGYDILQKRGSNVAVGEALEDLESDDAYVWVNAAAYLGSLEYSESVPYLIKSLRHTAWRSDDERVGLLQAMTGQDYGADFSQWQKWYLSQKDPIEIDWESSLGHSPRLPENRVN